MKKKKTADCQMFWVLCIYVFNEKNNTGNSGQNQILFFFRNHISAPHWFQACVLVHSILCLNSATWLQEDLRTLIFPIPHNL